MYKRTTCLLGAFECFSKVRFVNKFRASEVGLNLSLVLTWWPADSFRMRTRADKGNDNTLSPFCVFTFIGLAIYFSTTVSSHIQGRHVRCAICETRYVAKWKNRNTTSRYQPTRSKMLPNWRSRKLDPQPIRAPCWNRGYLTLSVKYASVYRKCIKLTRGS